MRDPAHVSTSNTLAQLKGYFDGGFTPMISYACYHLCFLLVLLFQTVTELLPYIAFLSPRLRIRNSHLSALGVFGSGLVFGEGKLTACDCTQHMARRRIFATVPVSGIAMVSTASSRVMLSDSERLRAAPELCIRGTLEVWHTDLACLQTQVWQMWVRTVSACRPALGSRLATLWHVA